MIPPEAFAPILEELKRRPIANNAYRLKAGAGRSQAFGVVNRRCLPPDYSRQCWKRPLLYKLLLDFGAQYVTPVLGPFTSITLNQNYAAAPHRDKGNEGPSFLVAFGSFKGGELVIHEGDLSGNHDICHKPIVADFSKILHSVRPFEGERYSLVFYKLARSPPGIPPPSVVWDEVKWRFKRGEEFCDGLPHPIAEFHKRLRAAQSNSKGES